VRRLITLAALVAVAAPAVACINDSELPGHEREFRSSYQQSDYRPPAPPTESKQPYVLGGAGLVLAALGVGLTYRSRAGR
jgi:hypothetical protein